jgi:hypothetical protein
MELNTAQVDDIVEDARPSNATPPTDDNNSNNNTDGSSNSNDDSKTTTSRLPRRGPFETVSVPVEDPSQPEVAVSPTTPPQLLLPLEPPPRGTNLLQAVILHAFQSVSQTTTTTTASARSAFGAPSKRERQF